MTKRKLRNIVGDNIRHERLSRDITIDELAELLKVSHGFVGLIERGQRGITLSTLLDVSRVFGVPVDDFFVAVDKPSLKLAEEVKPLESTNAKKKKVDSLLSTFFEYELDFVIASLQNMRVMSRSREELKKYYNH